MAYKGTGGGKGHDTAADNRAGNVGAGGRAGGGRVGGNGNGGGGVLGGRTASVIGNRFGAPSASAQAAAAARNAPTNGLFGGMGGLNARRTPNATPSYDPSLSNLAKVGMIAGGTLLGGGPMTALGMMGKPFGQIAGLGATGLGALTGFSGYRGMVNGPGDYDPKNVAGAIGSAVTPQGYRQTLAAMHPQPVTAPVAQQRPMSFMPARTIQSPLAGYSTFRPGYSFLGGR